MYNIYKVISILIIGVYNYYVTVKQYKTNEGKGMAGSSQNRNEQIIFVL